MSPTAQQIQNRLEWRDLLLDGEYVQGRIHLHSEHTETFCCLGVALDALTEGEWDHGIYRFADGTSCGGTMPNGVFNDLFGLDPDFPTQGDFVTANDTHRKSFAEIAEMITIPKPLPWWKRIFRKEQA